MFGHQDESQQQGDTPTFTASPPDPVSDGVLDDNITALANSDDTQSAPAPDTPALLEEHESDGQPATSVEPADTPLPPAAPAVPGPDTNDLLDIKQQALQQLSPLVGHLDQTPEEKFRTTMMMIQASDNQALLKVAYEAAQQISDEKTKAQALLDVVNEINYFTQHTSDNN